MMSEHMCGPEYAKGFFAGIREAVVASGARSKYLVSCVDHETDILGIDFDQMVGVTSASDGGLVTTFVDRQDVGKLREFVPYKWLGDLPIAYIDRKISPDTAYDGPQSDPKLFESILVLGRKYAKDAKKYALVSRKYYSHGLRMSGDHDVAEGTIRDGKVYHKIKSGEAYPATCECCTWDDETGDCSGTWCDA